MLQPVSWPRSATPWTRMADALPWRMLQTARATRRALARAPVPHGWARDAVKTQVTLARRPSAGRDGLVHAQIGSFDVAGFSASSLAYLHQEIFVHLAYWFRARRADPVIVDGGSNVGMSVLFFKALYPRARVLAFEPAERAHSVLVRNVAANDVRDVDVHRAALGARDGDVSFYEDAADPSTFRMSTRQGRISGSETSVPQRRLSEFVQEDVDLLKLDVEGSESDVIGELVEAGAIERIEQLVVEYHHHLDRERDLLGAFLERLSRQGFAYQVSATERVEARAAVEPVFQDVLVFARRSRLSA